MTEFRATFLAAQQFISTLERTDILLLFYLTPFHIMQFPFLRVAAFVSSCAADGRLLFHLSFFLLVLCRYFPTGITLQPAAVSRRNSNLTFIVCSLLHGLHPRKQNDYYDSCLTCKRPSSCFLRSQWESSKEFHSAIKNIS